MNSFMDGIETFYQKLSSSTTWEIMDSRIPINRAMNFGDGLFETMVWDSGEIRFFDKHIQRLLGGMEVLGLSADAIIPSELLELLTNKYPTGRKRVRWNVFRAGSGKYTPETSEVIQTLQITMFSPAPAVKQKVGISSKIMLFPTAWSSFKSLNSLPYVLANQERKERKLDEIILVDYRGYISESGASSIFWTKEGVIYTPSLTCSCINGVSRQVILEYLEENQILYKEGEFTIEELEGAERIFVSNCTGISYLENFNETNYFIEPLQFLQELFD